LIFLFWRNGGNAPTPTPFLFARLLQRPQGGRGGGCKIKKGVGGLLILF